MNVLQDWFTRMVPFVTPANAENWEVLGLALAWAGFLLLLVSLMALKFRGFRRAK